MPSGSRPGLGRTPATTLPQAIQMMRDVQTALDWVLNKQVRCIVALTLAIIVCRPWTLYELQIVQQKFFEFLDGNLAF